MAAEGGDMAQRRVIPKGGKDFGTADKRAKGHAAGHGFGNGHHVWYYVKALEGEKGAGASKSGLNFIEDKQSARLRAAFAQPAHPTLRRYYNTAFPLNGLCDHTGRLLIDSVQRINVIEREEFDIREEWPEGVLIDASAGHREGTMGIAVVGIFESDEFGAPGVFLGQLEGAFVGFRARHGKVDGLKLGRKLPAEQLGKPHLRLLNELTIHHDMQMPVNLLVDGFYHARMPVPQRGHGNAADEIDYLASVREVEMSAFCAFDGETNREVAGLGNMPAKGRIRGRHHPAQRCLPTLSVYPV